MKIIHEIQKYSWGTAIMTISMYQASIPVFISMLENLKQILKKGEAFAETKNIEEGTWNFEELGAELPARHCLSRTGMSPSRCEDPLTL